ncbi:hypothetical protein AMR72_15190 [Flavobacterium psychrophilum]|nr:hypothetical protein AMR72_15190 [Flavobacterium psychrophilum]AOE53742.1 hypothetical protein ALW18_15180 [Flavobacterium psychrophilum]
MEITGRLTRDAQVRNYNGRDVVQFALAVNESYKNKEGKRTVKTEFFNCWYNLTTKVAPYMVRGGVVEVTGWVSARAYTDNEGKPKASLNINVNRIKFHGGAAKDPVKDTVVYKAEIVQAGGQYAEQEHDDLPF